MTSDKRPSELGRPLIPLDEALAAYPAHLRALPTELVPIAQALHRVLRAPALAQSDLPRFSQSALDGYVLTPEDAARAPCVLKVTGSIAAGDTRSLQALRNGECRRILTGGRVPPSAGAVVAQERVTVDGSNVHLREPLKPGANIRWRGEELKSGAAVGAAGQRLTPGLIASLASAGVAAIEVARRPRVAVLVSGDELKPVGETLADGQIWDSNGPLVTSWLAARGYAASALHLPDDRAMVTQMLAQAFAGNDLVISTGGVSVGDKDYIIAAAESLGMRRVFWEVAQKPGKPIYFGVAPSPGPPGHPLSQAGEGNLSLPQSERSSRPPLDLARDRLAGVRTGERAAQTALLGLPGNPGAVLIGLTLHVRAALDLLEGADPAGAPMFTGVLAAAVKADVRRERLLRMRLDTDGEGRNLLYPLPNQDSHMLSNLSTATVLVRVPSRDAEYVAGEILRWTRL